MLVWSCIAFGILENGAGLITNITYRQALYPSLIETNSRAICALPANLARVVGFPIEERVAPGASPRNVFASNRLAFWWYGIQAMGVSPVLSWALGLTMMALVAVTGRKALQRLDATTQSVI